MASRGWIVVVSFLSPLMVLGCSKKQPPPPEIAPLAAKPAPEPLPVVGMDDPFARLTGEGVKALKAGYKAMRAKNYDSARAAFASVVTAFPDYTVARMQELKAAALGGHAGEIPALWKDLLARDFVAAAGTLDKSKDLAPLRAAPEWSRLKSLEASLRSAYALGVGQGILFVGRGRDGAAKPGEEAVKLDLNQEIYQVDAGLKRYRRLTDTDGHVFAFSAAPENKAISFLVVTSVADPGGAASGFADPSVGLIDLATLETTGPLPLGAPGTRAATVLLGWSGQGDPVWTMNPGNGGAEASYALDATRTAIVSVAVSGAIPTHRTVATPSMVSTERETPEQVTFGDDGMSLQITQEDRTLRATRPLDPTSIRWSPSGRLLAYAGAFSDCFPPPAGTKAGKNELYLWERGKKAAARIATAPSAFRPLWLDDNRLAYQAGVGKQSRIHVFDLGTRADTVLKPRAGAAFIGFDAVVCPGTTEEPGDEGAYDVEDDGAE